MKRKMFFISLIILVAVVAFFAAGVVPVPDKYPWIGYVIVLILSIPAVDTGAFILKSMNKDKSVQYDERMLKARGDAAINAFVVTIVTLLFIGAIDFACSIGLTVYDAAMITAMAGVGTFVILADIQDAYLGMKENRKMCAAVSGAVGIFIIVSWVYKMHRNPQADYEFSMLGWGITTTVISIEMFIKILCDMRTAKLETEDEKS